MKTRTKRFWAMLLMIVMILGTVPTSVFGENTPDSASCIVVKADAPAAATVSAGGLYKLNLETVFGDTEGHSLTYGFNTTVKNEHTKLAGSVFYFSSPEMGEYDVVLTAACSGGKELSHTLKMTVEKANEGIAAQYGYEETKKDSVTVKVTVSNDGYPILGSDEDETVLSHLEVTVPYFDLALYGLEDFYRYGTENGRGIYVNENLIERPTGLHLYIYLLERYYMGLPEEQCGKGTSGVLNYAKDIDVSYMNDAEAYSSDGKQALLTTGGATSIYMTNFWGHDENLMYFRNHCYPYMSPGWGATSDYILLSDGDTWDVAMFTDWNFYLRGYFARFDKDEYTAEPEAELTVKTQGWGTGSEAKEFQAKNELSVALYDSEWNEVGTLSYDSEDSNSITFKAPKAAGTYYLMAVDPDAATEEACIAPATAVLTVKEAAKECDECKDEDGNRICDECKKNFNKLPVLKEGVKDETVIIQTGHSYQLHDLSGGKIFTDEDDTLTSDNYKMRKSSDGGKTWSEWEIAFKPMDFGGITDSVVNSTAGIYVYEFKAFDSFGDSEDTWTLTLDTRDKVSANVKFYLGRDHQYSTTAGAEFTVLPVLELYKTAGIDENLYDYIGWYTKGGKTEYLYDPKAYPIHVNETDGKTYVTVDGEPYELHDYEKIAFTNSAFDEDDETAAPSGSEAGGYNMFYATIETGRYSTRVYGYNAASGEYDIYLGGQSMELPMEKDVYGNGGNDIYLRQVSVYASSKKTDSTYFTADDYYAEVIMPVTGSMIHAGDPYVKGNYTYFPFFSWAAGNGSLYNCYVYPKDTDNYIFSQAINNTTSAGTSVVTKSMTIATAVELKATVPADADFGLYFQYNNFNTKEVEPHGTAVVDREKGTKTISYKLTKGNGNYTWRLTDPSDTYVTKAGWLKCSADTEKTFTFSEFTNKASHDFSQLGTQVKTRDEGDIQVFLSATGFKGGVSELTRIRAYRMWQIIDTDSANIMIEPDYNIQVLEGNPSDITPVSGGNVKDNWIDVKPTTTDIVAVNYDALDVYTTSDAYGSHGGFYPATNPERTNVFVITNETAGSAVAHIPFNGSKETDRGAEWDYNYDTWSYLDSDEAPKLDFTVSGSGNVEVSYAAVITDDSLKSTLTEWKTLTAAENGRYYVDLLEFRKAGTKGGTVIIRMTDSTGTSYALVRAAEFTAHVENVSHPDEPIMPGDSVSVTFDGLYRSVNKISGVFNPTKYQLRYTSAGTELSGNLAQYQQMDRVSITLTIPEDLEFAEGQDTVDYTFTNGYIFGTMYSASNPFQTMYYMTDTGMGTNFSAVGTEYVLCRLADIPVTVYRKVTYDLKVKAADGGNALEDFTFTLTDPDGKAVTPDENGIYQDLSFGEYKYTMTKLGYVAQNGVMKLGSADKNNVDGNGILTKTITLTKAAENAWDGTAAAEPKKDEKGVYQIGTGAELAWLAKTVNAGTTGVNAVLTADIDLACYNWTPIGNSSKRYTGSFDGQEHKVYNLSIISETGATYQGLFGYVSGSISNLTVDGAISLTSEKSVSTAYAGGVAGGAGEATFTNVHSDVDITITRVKGNWGRVGGITAGGGVVNMTNCSYTGTLKGYQYAAGLVGYMTGGTISNSYNAGEISGNQYIAGIVGSSAGGSAVACYNVGEITATGSNAGGIAASFSSGKLTNCFNIGAVSASSNAGGIAGAVTKDTATVSDNYYLEDSCGAGFGSVKNAATQTAEEVTAETMASKAFRKGMNNGLEAAAYKQGETHPILMWEKSSCEHKELITEYKRIESTKTHVTVVTCDCGEPISQKEDPCVDGNKDYLCDSCKGKMIDMDTVAIAEELSGEKTLQGDVIKLMLNGEIAYEKAQGVGAWGNWTGFKLTAPQGVDMKDVTILLPDSTTRNMDEIKDGSNYAYLYKNMKGLTVAAFEIDWNSDGVYDMTVVLDVTGAALLPCDHEGAETTTTKTQAEGKEEHTITVICECGGTVSETTEPCTDADKNLECDVCKGAVACKHTETETTKKQAEGKEEHTVTVTCTNALCGDKLSTTTEPCIDADKNLECDVCEGAVACKHTETETTKKQVEGKEEHTVTVTCTNALCGDKLSTTTEPCIDEDKDLKCDHCKGAVSPVIAYGDVNGDGKVNATDAALVYRYVNGTASLNAEQLLLADVNGDSKINAVDAAMIYRHVNGTLQQFPAAGNK